MNRYETEMLAYLKNEDYSILHFLYKENYYYFLEYINIKSNFSIDDFSCFSKKTISGNNEILFDYCGRFIQDRHPNDLYKELIFLSKLVNIDGFELIKESYITYFYGILSVIWAKGKNEESNLIVFDMYNLIINIAGENDFRWAYFLSKKGALDHLRKVNFKNIKFSSLLSGISLDNYNLYLFPNLNYKNEIEIKKIEFILSDFPLDCIFEGLFGISSPKLQRIVKDLIETKSFDLLTIKAISNLSDYLKDIDAEFNYNLFFEIINNQTILNLLAIDGIFTIFREMNMNGNQVVAFLNNSLDDLLKRSWLVSDTITTISMIKEADVLADYLANHRFKDFNNLAKMHDSLVLISRKLKYKDFEFISDGRILLNIDGAVIDDYRIEVPKMNHKLLEYGVELHNCVGGYGKAINQRVTDVFVIFRGNELTYCVEIQNRKIRQFLGKYNNRVDLDTIALFTELLVKNNILTSSPIDKSRGFLN
jgi:hypothetical protein